MSRRCPWCREPLSVRGRGVVECPHCNRPLREEEGNELRPLDLRYQGVRASQCEVYGQLLPIGSVVVGIVALTMPLLHVAAVMMVPVLVVAHLLVLRLVLVREARRLLGTSRRMFTRWITRFSFLWIGFPGYGLAAVPVVGVVPAVAVFAGLTALVHHYTLWSLGRERERLPLMVWEKLLLAGLAFLTLALIGLVLALALVLGWGVAQIVELVRGLSAG